MADDMSYDYVWRLFQKEKQTNQLLQVNRNFYDDVAEYLKLSESNEQQKTNIEKILVGLFEKRRQKILLYAAYNKLLPQPTSEREQEFYKEIVQISEKYNIAFSKVRNRSNKLLRSINDIPEIILPSGKKFGPYKKGEIIEVQGADVDGEYLLKNSICENYIR